MNRIYVVSDGTGRTAEQALNAALTQFQGADVEIIRCAATRSVKKVRDIARRAARENAFVVHTLVTDELRAELVRAGRRFDVETIDLMGPLLGRLSSFLRVSPAEKPGLFNQLNRAYFRRVETVEFALDHDDGNRPDELSKAEIVLVGVSRTFKTPLSVYLAFKGWFVANVPIVPGAETPRQLERVPGKRVFFLDTNPRQLAALRRARDEYLKGEVGDYAETENVRLELMQARQVYHRHPRWNLVNVTSKPIEEIASEILSVRGPR